MDGETAQAVGGDVGLNDLLNAEVVALVGASPDFGRYGGRVWRFLHVLEFSGRIYAVNPKYTTIGDKACYPDLASLPEKPQHVGIAVGADHVMSIMRECARIGVKAVTVFSAGYAERGDQAGRSRQRELLDFARAYGIRVLGPNCNGAINWKSRLAMTATTTVLEKDAPAGCVGVVSQSGGVGQVNVMWRAIRAGLGISYQIACGNEADIDALDAIDFLLDDKDTRVVLVAIEGLRDGKKLAVIAAKAADLKKPILVFKIGRSEEGARAAASHTGAITGVDAVHDAAFEQLGILRVDDSQHLYQAAMLFAQGRAVTIDGISSSSVSGGCIAMIADKAPSFGLSFPDYAPATIEALGKIIPGFITVANPTDLSIDVQGKLSLSTVLRALADDPNIGINLPILTMAPRRDFDALLEFAKASSKPTAIIWTGGCTDECLPEIDRVVDGIPIYRDIDAALRSAGFIAKHAAFLKRRSLAKAPSRPADVDRDRARSLLSATAERSVTERESKAIFATYGIEVTREVLARTADEAVAAAGQIGAVVALKIESHAILHKTDAGCVQLGLLGTENVKRAFDDIMRAAKRAYPDAALNGVLVQEMAARGVELILGSTNDPTYGPVVAIGLGGIFAEYIGKPVFRLPPFSVDDARQCLDGLPGRALLQGVRGMLPVDTAALAETISRFSWLAADFGAEIAEMEINPLIVGPGGAIAVDGLIVRT